MRSARPEQRRFARRLLALEASADQTHSAAFSACEKLRRPLAVLAGIAGFRALLSRALALANGEVRWLKAVHVNANGSLEGLEGVRAQVSPDDFARGEEILVAQLVGLLATFIGEALTLRLVQEVWPEISVGDLNSEMEKDDG
jgi:hypothetical protein